MLNINVQRKKSYLTLDYGEKNQVRGVLVEKCSPKIYAYSELGTVT